MMVYPAKLPPAAELRRTYLAGNLTLRQIGEQYGVREISVVNKLKRHAAKEGLSWPLKSAVPGWNSRAQKRRHDAVRTDLLRDAMADCVADYAVTYEGIASRAGLSDNLAWRISAGINTRVSRKSAEALVAAMDAIERDATGVDWDDYASSAVERAVNVRRGRPSGRAGVTDEHLDTRRALVAEMVAAGYSSRTLGERFGVAKSVIDDDRAIVRKRAA